MQQEEEHQGSVGVEARQNDVVFVPSLPRPQPLLAVVLVAVPADHHQPILHFLPPPQIHNCHASPQRPTVFKAVNMKIEVLT